MDQILHCIIIGISTSHFSNEETDLQFTYDQHNFNCTGPSTCGFFLENVLGIHDNVKKNFLFSSFIKGTQYIIHKIFSFHVNDCLYYWQGFWSKVGY